MMYIGIVQSEFLKEARDWEDLTLKEQQGYLRKHPRSKRRLTVKPPSFKPLPPKVVARLQFSIRDSLRKLPFIGSVRLGRDFYNNPRVSAFAGKGFKSGDTSISVNMSKDHVEFHSIIVAKDDRGKGHGDAMVRAVCDAIVGTAKDVPVYLSDPYNFGFWNRMREKYPGVNWRWFSSRDHSSIA